MFPWLFMDSKWIDKGGDKYVVRNSVLDTNVNLVCVRVMDDLAELQSIRWQHTTFHRTGSLGMESVWSANSRIV